jgi:hypothetical protein
MWSTKDSGNARIRTCSEISEPGSDMGGASDRLRSWVRWADKPTMRRDGGKHDVGETTQRRLEGVDEVVAVGGDERKEETGAKGMQQLMEQVGD